MLGWTAALPRRILPFSPQQNELLPLLPRGSRNPAGWAGVAGPFGAPARPVARCPGSSYPISPGTGLNGSPNSSLGPAPSEHRAAQRTALCPPRGCPGAGSGAVRPGAHPGCGPCNSRRASARRGEKQPFLRPHKRKCGPGRSDTHFPN